MPIRADRIEQPDFVEAAANEPLEQVRDKLRSPGGGERWQAYIVARSADGQYAVASVFDLRPVLWEEGPAALKRPLRDWPQFHFQPGVEMDSISQAEAEAEANRYGGYLVVLRDGQYAGLVRGTAARRGTDFRPPDAFDFFDELLPTAALAQTEFVAATLNTTVAKVALDLKARQNPQEAYVLVELDDGSFGLITARKLRDEALRRGPGVWGDPLRVFEPHLDRAIEIRKLGTVGRKQAEAITARKALILTENGEPAALLPKRAAVLRSDSRAEAFGPVPKGPGDLFTTPAGILQTFPAEAEPKVEPRVVNLWFADGSRRRLPQEQALELHRAYSLTLNIGRPDERSIARGGESIREPLPERAEGTTLYVSVFADPTDFQIDNPTRSLLLPPWGDSAPITFEVTPRRRTFGPNDRASLDVHVYYRCNVVQSWQVQVEVVPAGQPAQGETPQEARLVASRTEDYVTLAEIGPRHLSVSIDRAPDGSYRFDFVVAADEQADRVQLSYRATLRRADLTHLITKARRQLYNISRSPDYQGNLAGTPAAFRLSMKALATIGRQLYLKLFHLREQEGSGAEVAQWIEDGNLKRDSRIQIVDRAGDFVFPWALIYDGDPWGGDEIDAEGFWGIRYQIEVVPEALLRRYSESGPLIEAEAVSLSVGVYDYLPGASQQKAFFQRLGDAAGARLKADLFRDTPGLQRVLHAADQHLVYFFCHGFTERMATDIQLEDDLIAEFKAWRKGLPEEEKARLEGAMTHYDALFDVSDSWLQLTYGKAPLTFLEDTLLKAETRFGQGPLVFLNMCESAQVLPSLSGGFVPFFIDAGARGVIGTECPMTSTFADPFAQEFLRRFLAGQPVGQILLALRREYLARSNPLGLAYTLYSDADLRLAAGIPVPEAAAPVEK